MTKKTTEQANEHVLMAADQVDILLVLEGTYPYVHGGVSSWVHEIITAFPQYTFGAIFLGSIPEDYKGILYDLPKNLIHLETYYLFDFTQFPEIEPHQGNAEAHEFVGTMHEWFREPEGCQFDEHINNLDFYLDPKKGVDYKQFLYCKESWKYISKMYDEHCTDPSFIDYFWQVRNMHTPIWQCAQIANTAPKARMVHTISTGYAGFLAGLIKHNQNIPMALSEHGIYTKERRIELLKSKLYNPQNSLAFEKNFDISYLKKIWMGFFEALGRYCYRASDPIVSLFEETRSRQVIEGADEARTLVIPNGINIDRFRSIRQVNRKEIPPVFCLLGRVVPIKDIKTFIRAMRSIINKIPKAEAWIVGPTDESPAYMEECNSLIESLDLQDKVKFLGHQDPVEIFPKIGLMVLSSISEGLPLVILEAYAAGIPVVSTDVGSCRQLIEGDREEDRAIGSSGRVVGMADPIAFSAACLELACDTGEWNKCSKAAVTRVEKYYADNLMFDSYKEIYEGALS